MKNQIARHGVPAVSIPGRMAVSALVMAWACALGCANDTTQSPGSGGSIKTGGTSGGNGGAASGGTPGSGGTTSSGGSAGSGGTIGKGGTTATGGAVASGGSTASGGSIARGGSASGGASAAGGSAGSGGTLGKGGTTAAGGGTAMGGTSATGGVVASGGRTGTGGVTIVGGFSGTGGGGGATGPQTYSPTWASVDQHPPAPEWFQDAKFALWTHWGAFSTPAFGSEWYPRNMYNKSGNSSEYQHHMSVFGDPFGNWPYHNFLDGANDKSGKLVQFAPKEPADGGKWDPEAWAQLFADAGAKMAGPVAEHHDGFSLWDSACNEWNAADRGPKRDLVERLAQAYRAKGMKFLVSTHTAYNFSGYFQWVAAQSDASLKKLYGQLSKAEESALWLCKEKELIDKFQPDYMWHDFGMNNVTEAHRLEYLAYYYNKAVAWGKDVVVSYNDGFNTKGEIHQVERGGEAGLSPTFWLSEDTVSLSTWGYTEGMRYYTTKALLHALIDRVAKNGFLLLNTSPMADGTFPQGQKDILLGMGAWLKVFGEAIYNTRAWTKFGEGPTAMGGGDMGAPAEGRATDIRFTRSKDNKTLYAIELGWPSGNQMVITSLKSGSFDASTMTGVTFIGGAACTYTQDSTGLKISLPATGSTNTNGYAVKLTFSGTIPTPR